MKKKIIKICNKIIKTSMLPPCTINIIFTSKKNMKKINFAWRKTDNNNNTDVLSFQIKDNLFIGKNKLYLGDLVLCIKQVKKQTNKFKVNLKEEISILITHGIIHLIGIDHNKNKLNFIKQALYETSILNVLQHLK